MVLFDKLKNISKAVVDELVTDVIIPSLIHTGKIMNENGKSIATNIQSKNKEVLDRISLLEDMQGQGERLEKGIDRNLTMIKARRYNLILQLTRFDDVFEKIHNRPSYKIKSGNFEIPVYDLLNMPSPDTDYDKLDNFLVDMYAEDAGILQGLCRTPVFAAILIFRQKALVNKFDNLLVEVNQCIDNLISLVHYLMKINTTSSNLSKELTELEVVFKEQVDKLSKIVSVKMDFEEFSEEEITILDTNIKLVGIILKLMNAHICDKKEVSAQGFAKVNIDEVLKVVKESEKVRLAV
ncbi:hypothetical protein [Gottfriedia acidiceleris]|uniref:Uncharacterized protein n=1 Tax=Gottfriedia acidiceleris TaxID=371036 RepID=A0ABY4JR92_9BACI|nr:hypothetical protein [Gottfriedia acidiceleris]UPM56370.1 hypothetical protein MY490_11255 [Gottfriedia acidiceleris]